MRSRIKRAAVGLLIKHGYRGLKFGDIATRLGTTRANIHYHFGTKQKLVEEVIDDYLAETLERYRPIWLTRRPPSRTRSGRRWSSTARATGASIGAPIAAGRGA